MRDVSSRPPLGDIARSVSSHLDALAAEVFAIEHAIGDEMGQSTRGDGNYVKRLQRLDYLRQSLEDLALLNLLISDHCAGHLPDGVEDKLRLATTKELLGATPSIPPSVMADDRIGDVDLF